MIRTLIIAGVMSVLTATGCSGYYERPPYDARYSDDYGYEEPGVDVGMFAELSYYGSWFDLHGHGWVWRPHMRAGWQPYYSGHWVWSQYGWMWVSYEPFGWATYHYGYWICDARVGWVWIPGYDWSPCRVEWAVFDNYVCWAPLPPPGVRIGDPWNPARVNVWIVVDGGRFTDPDVGRYRVSHVKYKSQYRHEQVRRDAPRVQTIERYKGHGISRVSVQFKQQRQGGHEFKRVELPDRESRIVERHRVDVPRVEHRERDNRGNREQEKRGHQRKKNNTKKSKDRDRGHHG